MSSTDPQVLDDIVKAYDVRGTVPDQLNADVAHALGVGFARFAKAPRVLVGRDMRPSGPELVDAFARGVHRAGRRRRRPRAGLDRPRVLRRRHARRARRDVHRLAQPGPVQRRQVLPRRRPSGRAGHRSGRDQGASRPTCSTATARRRPHGRARPPAATCSARSSTTSCRSSTPTSMRPLRVVADTANGMGGLVVPAVFERLPQIDARGDVRRARRHVPQPPGRSAAAGQPARPAGPRRRPVASTSGWPSTATPTASSSSTRPAAASAARPRRRCSPQRSCARTPARRSCTT